MGLREGDVTYMAGEQVQYKVECGASPRGFQKDTGGADDLRQQREDPQHARNVLEHHDVAQRILRVDVHGAETTHMRNHYPDHNLPYGHLTSTLNIHYMIQFVTTT